MASFEDQLARERAKRQASTTSAEQAAAAEAARREAIRQSSAAAAQDVLSDLHKAIRALQASSARKADRHAPGSGVTALTTRGLLGEKVAHWEIGYRSILVPRTGRPSAYRPGLYPTKKMSLEAFAGEGHWWWTSHNSSTGVTTVHEADASIVFRNAVESIARYLAQIE